MPACSLKYLPKNEGLGKFRSLETSCIVMSVKRSRCSMAFIVKSCMMVLGRLFIVSFRMVERYLGVMLSWLANSSTLRILPCA